MTSPFINQSSSKITATKITVNNIKPNSTGNIKVPITSLSDVIIDNLVDGQTLKYDLLYLSIGSLLSSPYPSNVFVDNKLFCSATFFACIYFAAIFPTMGSSA
jgi:hypothetical protein